MIKEYQKADRIGNPWTFTLEGSTPLPPLRQLARISFCCCCCCCCCCYYLKSKIIFIKKRVYHSRNKNDICISMKPSLMSINQVRYNRGKGYDIFLLPAVVCTRLLLLLLLHGHNVSVDFFDDAGRHVLTQRVHRNYKVRVSLRYGLLEKKSL